MFQYSRHQHKTSVFPDSLQALSPLASTTVANFELRAAFNFLKTNAGKVSGQTIGAAAFFVQRAQSLGLKWAPFFLDPVWLGKIEKKILETG